MAYLFYQEDIAPMSGMLLSQFFVLLKNRYVVESNNAHRPRSEPLDSNEFFRKATLQICGNLEIEQAMRACIGEIGDVVPVDRMFLQIYEPDLGAMRTMAMATPVSCEEPDLLAPPPRQAVMPTPEPKTCPRSITSSRPARWCCWYQ